MTLVLILLVCQGVLGAIDTLWHHEGTARLPSSPTARPELVLHGLREAIYAVIFLSLPWMRWEGWLAWALAVLLAVEIVITLQDFLLEDRTRRLPPTERVLHTVMAIGYGALLALLAPLLVDWAARPTAFVAESHGWLSWVATALGLGVLVWTVRDLAAGTRAPEHAAPAGEASGRTVLVTGATGFIGAALMDRLIARGDRIVALVRDDTAARLRWPRRVLFVRSLSEIPLEMRIDAVVNLAGAPVAAGPWTGGRRRLLLGSRLDTTRAVAALLDRLERRPGVVVNASATGVYGDRSEAALDETSPAGNGFMADLVRLWEVEQAKLATGGTRVCSLRFGMVFHDAGGPLALLALPARFGMAAILGGGRQWTPWIHLDDAVRLIETALRDARYSGPINAVAPDLVTQGELTRALAFRFRTPQWLQVPAWPLRLLLGEMSDLFLASQRVTPARLKALGFQWTRPTLPDVFEPASAPAEDTVRPSLAA
jgi:uncharacterized protein (TIGR01777 family)